MDNLNALEYKGYYGTVEYSKADNVLFGQVIGINGLISYEGNSISELKIDFESSIDDYLDMCNENGVEAQRPYKGTFNVRIKPELHQKLSIYAAVNKKSLNAAVEEAITKFIV